ncbi:MAG: hypothetical protein ACYC0Q_00690 [Eubacteriales bacterium]
MASFFATITGRVVFEHSRCRECEGKPCAASCQAGILKLCDGVPVPAMDVEQIKKGKCTECLACELACRFQGNGGLKIELPVPGLDELLGVS